MFKNKSIPLYISGVLALAYAIYIIISFADLNSGSVADGNEIINAILTVLLIPHLVVVVIAIILNWIGYFKNSRGFALTAGFLYILAGVLFIVYFVFVLPSMILCFLGARNIKKIKEKQELEKVSKTPLV